MDRREKARNLESESAFDFKNDSSCQLEPEDMASPRSRLSHALVTVQAGTFSSVDADALSPSALFHTSTSKDHSLYYHEHRHENSARSLAGRFICKCICSCYFLGPKGDFRNGCRGY